MIHKIGNPFKTLLSANSVLKYSCCRISRSFWHTWFRIFIAACSASALAVAFFRLLDLHSYAHFDILKIQPEPSLDEIPSWLLWKTENSQYTWSSLLLTTPHSANYSKLK